MLGIHWLREAFEKAVPGYDRGVTVPAIVDIPSGAVVTADFRHITLDLEQEWTAYHRAGAPDLYPAPLRDEIEEVSGPVYRDVNNGVYRCGFAAIAGRLRRGVRAAVRPARLARGAARRPAATWSATRSPRRTSGCGRRWPGSTRSTRATSSATGTSSTEMPVLWAYARDLFQTPGFGDTIDFVQTKQHYYLVHTNLNPSRHRP